MRKPDRSVRAGSFALALFLAGSATAHDVLFEHGLGSLSPAGLQVAGLGDVDGDGVPDFALGAPGDGYGQVHVISGASQAPIFTFAGDSQTIRFGTRLALVGDVDLDGVPDLAVSAIDRVRLFSLRAGQPLYTLSGVFGDRFGYALAGVGDVDGDGSADLAVGAPQVTVIGGGDVWHIFIQGPGFVQVFSGTDGTHLRTYFGEPTRLGFGGSICNGGALDGDSVDDLVVSHFMDPFVPGASLDAHCFSGATGSLLLQVALLGPGAVVSELGDVDADGVADFVLGEPTRSVVRAISGSTGLALYTSRGLGPYDRFGATLARVDDLDGDGFADLVVGAPQPELTGGSIPVNYPVGPGYARLVSGRSGSRLETLVGNRENQGLGFQASSLGDIDGDGLGEFIVTGLFGGGGADFARVYAGRSGFSAPTRYCVGAYNSVGSQASIGYSGSVSLSANQLSFTLSGAVPGQLGLLLCGRSASSQAFELLGVHPGYLCVGPQAFRLGPPLLISSSGTLERPVDLSPGASPFLLGSTWYFQFAYFSNPAQRNSSDALAVTFVP